MMDCSFIFRHWREWIRLFVIVLYFVLLVIALPLCIWELERNGAPDHVEAWFVGGLFVMMALPISFWGILQHVINYTTPRLQRHIIRILWMVPVYALNAWFALRFPAAAIYLDTLRECYEAYVIYNFMAYLMAFLTHEYPHLEIQVENKPPVKHIFPLCLLPPSQLSRKFIQRCKHGVLQYTVVRPLMTVIALICEMCGKYEEGDFNFVSSWSYLVIINNGSQILAMYCLVLFYKAFREELAPLNPVPKFICVKAVVFLSFWQSLVIAGLAKSGAIPTNGQWIFYKDIKEVSTGLQDFLICIEMFLAALAHFYSFSHKPFVNLAAQQDNFLRAFFSMWDVRDVTEDVVEHARYIGQGVRKNLTRVTRSSGDEERKPLLSGAGPIRGAADSMENYATHKSPSPAAMLDDDRSSYGGDSLTASGRHYENFVNKSTSSSMNNYLEYESSTDVKKVTKDPSKSVGLQAYDDVSSNPALESNTTTVKVEESSEQNLIEIDEKDFELVPPGGEEKKDDIDEVFEDLEAPLEEEDKLEGDKKSDTAVVDVSIKDVNVSLDCDDPEIFKSCDSQADQASSFKSSSSVLSGDDVKNSDISHIVEADSIQDIHIPQTDDPII